jgi:carbon-monoxide dehydrogenase medium subunit
MLRSMKAAAVDYARPASLGEAIALLARGDVEARPLAGGQSLVAMMNLRLAAPDLLVDIARLPELAESDEDDASVTLGACVTHAAIEDGRVPDPSRGLIPHVAASLAYRAIRNRGTLGGSLALADPAAEWPAVVAALDGAVVATGPQGERVIPAADFVTGLYETRLAPGEIVARLRLPKLSPAARWGYVKLARKAGEFALSLAVAVRDPARGLARIVIGAADGPPLVIDGEFDAARTRAAIDARGFDAFRGGLHAAAALRAARQARP